LARVGGGPSSRLEAFPPNPVLELLAPGRALGTQAIDRGFHGLAIKSFHRAARPDSPPPSEGCRSLAQPMSRAVAQISFIALVAEPVAETGWSKRAPELCD
jgi:hypothetical protein